MECRCHASESTTAAGSEHDFVDRIQVVTFRLSTESIDVCYHWVSQTGGVVKYDGRAVNTWNPNSEFTSDYVSTRRCARNALDRVMTENRKWISSDLEIIEQRLAVEKTNQITPPQGQSDQVDKRKRGWSKMDQVSRAPSRSSHGKASNATD